MLDVAGTIQENAEDIYAGAKQINEDRAVAEAEYLDEEEESATEAE